MDRQLYAAAVACLLLLAGCGASAAHAAEWRALRVVASAYNSLPSQTTRKRPAVAAWGNKLKPGMRAIAVSRDLIRKGLKRGTRVRIQGLPGVYVVRDKMAPRWRNKIDIYMGRDVARARDYGVRHGIRILYADKDNS